MISLCSLIVMYDCQSVIGEKIAKIDTCECISVSEFLPTYDNIYFGEQDGIFKENWHFMPECLNHFANGGIALNETITVCSIESYIIVNHSAPKGDFIDFLMTDTRQFY